MKRMISIDKWELSFDFKELTKLKLENENNLNFENFNLQKNNGKSNYKVNFDIYLNNGLLFGKLYFGSYKFNRQKLYILIDNKILYSDYIYFISEIQNALDLEFINNSILDIAYDVDYNIINKFYKLIKDKDIDLIILNKKYGMDDEIGSLLNLSVGTRRNIRKNKSFYIQNKDKGLVLNGYDKLKEIEDNDNEKSYIKDYLNYKSIFRLEVRTKHNLLVDTLNKIGYTDIYLYQCILNRELDELYFIYDELLRRLIRIEYNNKVYSLIDFI